MCMPKAASGVGGSIDPSNHGAYENTWPRHDVTGTAKVFRTGRSQPVRLPAAFRFDTKEVFVRRDEATGDVILSHRPADWQALDAAVMAAREDSADVLRDRRDEPPRPRALFRWPRHPGYMLDTNAASAIIRGDAALMERLRAQPVSSMCISAVTEGELRHGLARKPDAKALHAAVAAFLQHVQSLPWKHAAASRYGELRAGPEAAGTKLGNLDTLIAAHALAVGTVLVRHERAFQRVPGLRVEDWAGG